MGIMLTKQQFIDRAINCHGNKYDYSVSEYLGRMKPINITCQLHGKFTQCANDHLQGNGCQKCGIENQGKNRSKSAIKNKEHLLIRGNNTISIPLTKGKVAIIDNDDLHLVNSISWRLHSQQYAYSNKGLMHRIIMKCPDGMEVDHINHDKLDNRKINLRICTKSENSRNTKSNIGSESRFKGVSLNLKIKSKWFAKIHFKGRNIYVGSFMEEEQAAMAYDKKAKELFGEFAYLNFK